MTKGERVEKLKYLITCMKCEVSGKECDVNCPTQYDAGNMGEIIENLEEIAKALEQEPTDNDIVLTYDVYHELIADRAEKLEQESVLDKIRAEIDAESAKSYGYPNWERAKALEWALGIIDKYKAETEAEDAV